MKILLVESMCFCKYNYFLYVKLTLQENYQIETNF